MSPSLSWLSPASGFQPRRMGGSSQRPSNKGSLS
jgi:hypothetical protein